MHRKDYIKGLIKIAVGKELMTVLPKARAFAGTAHADKLTPGLLKSLFLRFKYGKRMKELAKDRRFSHLLNPFYTPKPIHIEGGFGYHSDRPGFLNALRGENIKEMGTTGSRADAFGDWVDSLFRQFGLNPGKRRNTFADLRNATEAWGKKMRYGGTPVRSPITKTRDLAAQMAAQKNVDPKLKPFLDEVKDIDQYRIKDLILAHAMRQNARAADIAKAVGVGALPPLALGGSISGLSYMYNQMSPKERLKRKLGL